MGQFRKILLSGSNAHIRELKVSELSLNNSTNNKVVMYDTTTGQFFFTGSYKDGGQTTEFTGTFDGDMDLTVEDGSDETRKINIGSGRTTAGECQINFFNSSNPTPGFRIETSNEGAHFILSQSTGTNSGNGTLSFRMVGGSDDKEFIVGVDNALDVAEQNFIVDGNGQISMPHLSSTTAAATNLVYNTVTKQVKFYSSTKKLKTNIKPLDDSMLKAFDKLKPVTFNALEDTLQTSNPSTIVGFIAEECADANPSLVVWGSNYGVNDKGSLALIEGPINDEIVPTDIQSRAILSLVVAKIQELDTKIKELKNLKSNGTI